MDVIVMIIAAWGIGAIVGMAVSPWRERVTGVPSDDGRDCPIGIWYTVRDVRGVCPHAPSCGRNDCGGYDACYTDPDPDDDGPVYAPGENDIGIRWP